MSETKITDLVPQKTIDEVVALDTQIQSLLTTYTDTAKELAKGLDIHIRVVGDLDKLEKLLTEKTKEATATTEQLNSTMARRAQVMANTTNTISRQLMEQERLNKAVREQYRDGAKVKAMVEEISESYENNTKTLAKYDLQIKANKNAQSELAKAFKEGAISQEDYIDRQAKLLADARRLAVEKANLTQVMKIEEKLATDNGDSYSSLSHQLELLKNQYKQMDSQMRESDVGREFERVIQELDAHLKDMAADMGEFLRNVGNYAIAGQQGVVSTESVIEAMNKEARTTQDLIDQTKILEEAKKMLDKRDEDYQSTLTAMNAKIDANKRELSDVSDILNKTARNVAEAEEQNKRLAAALRLVDVNAEGASEVIQQYRDKIDVNNETISRATGSNEQYTDSMLSIIGINADFGSSLESLANSGGHSFIDGLNTKVKALGKTLMGLLANPWVLAILGIAGVAAGFKWWYEYNKGLIEATKLTKDFTQLTGDDLKAARNEVQALADAYDKDFREVLESANAMAKQFGISFQEAMKLIEDGFIAGADVNGEFLENIKEYTAYFKEAGISASEFIAITTQANQMGIYSDKGIDVIKEGNLRIREMTKATADALAAIGISAKEVQKSLEDGSKTTFDIMKEVSAKLAEFPESASEVGTALADIFGGPGEDAGLQYILTLKEIDTNLDNVKDRAGELGDLQEAQLRSQVELENIIASVFDATGGSFESMTTKAKIFVNDGIIAIIKGCGEIVNWFVKLYNEAIAARVAVATLVAVFKSLWTAAKGVFDLILNGFKGMGGIMEGIMLIFSGELENGMNKIKSSLANGFKGMYNIAVASGREIGANFANEFANVAERRLQTVTIGINTTSTTSSSASRGGAKTKPKGLETDAERKAREKAAEKAAKDAEKAAKEELKLIFEIEESKLAIMRDGHDKELAMIRLKFRRKIEEIKGNGKEETELRVKLVEQCQYEIAQCELKYQTQLARINLENRLAIVKKGSREELDLKLAQIEASRAVELQEAEKTGADLSLINEKFNKERLDLEEEFAAAQSDLVMKRFSEQKEESETQHILDIAALQREHNDKLKAAKGNHDKIEKAEKEFQKKMDDLNRAYAIKQAQQTVEMYEKMLNTAGLSAELRLQIEQDLARARAELEKLMSEAGEPNTGGGGIISDEVIEKFDRWSKLALDAFSTVNDAMQTYYDNQIAKIEELQEANEAAAESEQERIEELVNKKVISEEEGEARKRAAAAETAKKNEQLEKRKQQLKIKQAKWDKANSIAQATISTSLAVMNALKTDPFWLGLALAAIASAMGAVQIATIVATPIPAYAKGTDRHSGGLAVVGDGGRNEVVMLNGSAWMTPDRPTLVDMPAGAVVYPSITDFGNRSTSMTMTPNAPVKVYDDSGIRRGVSELAYLIRTQTKQQHIDSYNAKHALFKSERI